MAPWCHILHVHRLSFPPLPGFLPFPSYPCFSTLTFWPSSYHGTCSCSCHASGFSFLFCGQNQNLQEMLKRIQSVLSQSHIRYLVILYLLCSVMFSTIVRQLFIHSPNSPGSFLTSLSVDLFLSLLLLLLSLSLLLLRRFLSLLLLLLFSLLISLILLSLSSGSNLYVHE